MYNDRAGGPAPPFGYGQMGSGTLQPSPTQEVVPSLLCQVPSLKRNVSAKW